MTNTETELMAKPGAKLNVPCDRCGAPSHYTKTSKNGIGYYSCDNHREWLELVIDSFKRPGQHLSKIR